MSYRDIVTQDLRLAVLQALEEDPDYSHNEQVIQRVLGALGHGVSADRMRTELRWLEEQGLVHLEDAASLLVVRLSRRGEDVALGRARVDGVARVRPRV
jgi:Fe2+ or Zn2+ uptake regulation protein